jgi:hypothetical protein
LTVIDVSDSRNVTGASVNHLLELRGITFLKLDGTGIRNEEYAVIISGLPNITNIVVFPVNGVLYHIAEQRLDKITHVHNHSVDVTTLPQTCPNTTNISLSSVASDLSGLTTLNALRSLELFNLRYDRCNLNFVLTAMGDRLTDLKMKNVWYVNHQDIITLCSSLVNFKLVSCSFVHLAHPPLDPHLPHFRKVINLKIDNIFAEPIDFTFVRYYSSLQTLDLRCISIFTVDFVREIENLGTFAQLEVLHVEELVAEALTMDSVRLLIQHCALLKRIEGLRRCPHFNAPLIEQLKHEITSHNLDLEIKD